MSVPRAHSCSAEGWAGKDGWKSSRDSNPREAGLWVFSFQSLGAPQGQEDVVSKQVENAFSSPGGRVIQAFWSVGVGLGQLRVLRLAGSRAG